jgi:SAM-dependent methyltransferase
MQPNDRSRLAFMIRYAMRHPGRIVPHARRLARDAVLRLRNRDHVSYYRAVMRSDAARSDEGAVGSRTHESWLKLGQMQFDYLVSHGLKPGMRMLEIGCGNLRAGRLFIEHLNAGDYYGIDISPDILLAAQRTLAEAGLQHKLPHLTLVQDLKLEFLPAGYFDVVHAHSVFSHSPIEVIDECLAHVGRVMKPGGFFDFTFDRTEGAEHHVLREDFYYRTETLVALAGRHGLTGQFMKDWEELPHPQSKLRISRLGGLRYTAIAVSGEGSCHGGDRRGAAAHPALVYSIQPGHSAPGPEVLAVGRANAAGTGTTNPHLVGRGDQAAAPHLGERQACRATSGAFAAARISGRT